MNELARAFMDCRPFLSEQFCNDHQRLFIDEHVQKIADSLYRIWEQGIPENYPPPHLTVECTPPMQQAFAAFRQFLALWHVAVDKTDSHLLKELAATLMSTGTQNLLVLLGQRLTPASITDARAFPVPRKQLLQAANIIYSANITTAARALTKHAQRHNDKFWGEVRGSEAQRNELAIAIINRILDNSTWWNVFSHYKHNIVYEARVSNGYGARWGNDGSEFIGFLEPFSQNFPEVRD